MQVRLPKELSTQVQRLASEQKRSVSQMTAILVEHALSERGTPVSPRTVVLPETQAGWAEPSGDPTPEAVEASKFRGPDFK